MSIVNQGHKLVRHLGMCFGVSNDFQLALSFLVVVQRRERPERARLSWHSWEKWHENPISTQHYLTTQCISAKEVLLTFIVSREHMIDLQLSMFIQSS